MNTTPPDIFFRVVRCSLSSGQPNLILDDPLLSQLLTRMGSGSGSGALDAMASKSR